MKTVGASEARTHLARLLREVEAGKTVKITRRGVPVALLRPVEDRRQRNIAEVIAELKEFRKGKELDGISIRELIEEGRRN